MSDSNVLPLTPGTFYLPLRQDFILICQNCTYRKEKSKSSPYCKALILAVLEHWTNNKIDKGKKDLFVNMTFPQWEEAMYNLYKRNVIADSLEELIEEGFISREAFKTGTGGRDQYRYLLNTEKIKQILTTVTFHSSETEEHGKVTYQHGKITVATVKSNSSSSVATVKNHTFIDNTNHYIDSTQREGSKSDNPAQNASPTKSSPLTPSEQEFVNCFTRLIEKHTGWKNFKAVLPAKSHTDYVTFQEIAGRNPSHEEMERVFLAFWNQQDRNKEYWWRKISRLTFSAFCRRYDEMFNAAMPLNANESHEKPPVQGLTHENAVELEKEIVATTSKHGYEVTTNVVEEDGVWLVKMLWEQSKAKIESVSHWHEVFETMQDMTEESQELQLA